VIRDATGGKYHGPDTSMVQVRSVPLGSPEKIPIFFASFSVGLKIPTSGALR
jgi:hypothetical protein